MVSDLRQVQTHLALVQSLDRVRRGGVQAPLLRGAQPGGHRRANQRVRKPLMAGTVAGDEEPGGAALVQGTEQGQHGHIQHPGHNTGREAVAGHRSGMQQLLCGVRHLCEPVGRRRNHPSRHRPRSAAALLEEHACQLPDQERIAPRFGVHLACLFR